MLCLMYFLLCLLEYHEEMELIISSSTLDFGRKSDTNSCSYLMKWRWFYLLYPPEHCCPPKPAIAARQHQHYHYNAQEECSSVHCSSICLQPTIQQLEDVWQVSVSCCSSYSSPSTSDEINLVILTMRMRCYTWMIRATTDFRLSW